MSAARKIQALFRGARFERCCCENRSARVWSVHNRVINIKTQDELLALALPQVGGSSRFLCLNSLPEVACGDTLQLTSSALIIYTGATEIAVDLQNVPRWHGPLDSLTGGRGRQKGTYLMSCRDNWLSLQDIRYVPFCLPRPPVKLSPQTVAQWVGLGPGLTPAGDDVLLGYLAVYNHLGPDPAWKQAMHSAVSAALGQTTTLSAQLLKNALEYDYHESIQRVVAILCGLSSENLLSALRQVARIGASSGESIIYGMQLALEDISANSHMSQKREVQFV